MLGDRAYGSPAARVPLLGEEASFPIGAYVLAAIANAPLVTVFNLREVDGVESKEICTMLNISENNLWVMLHRARMALRECLELNWFENKPKLEGTG